MTFQQLQYVAAIAKHRNFTRAAEACHVAQPALSQQIRKLEEELGSVLFERTRHGAEPTAAGTEFLPFAERVLQLLWDGKKRVSDLRTLRLGFVSVLCPPTVVTYWLPNVVLRFQQLHPGVEIQVHERAGCIAEDLNGTMSDLGIVQLDPRRAVPSRSGGALQAEFLFTDEQVLIFPKHHWLAGGAAALTNEPIPLSAAANEPFVLHKPPCGLSLVAERAFQQAGMQPRVAIESSQIEAVCEMVAAGLGVGLMPKMAMLRDHPKLQWREITAPRPARRIGLAWFSERALSPAARTFAELIRQEARTNEPTASFQQYHAALVQKRRMKPAAARLTG